MAPKKPKNDGGNAKPTSIRFTDPSLRDWVDERRAPSKRSMSNQVEVDLETLRRMMNDKEASKIVERFRP